MSTTDIGFRRYQLVAEEESLMSIDRVHRPRTRWTPYNGYRIKTAGWRAVIEEGHSKGDRLYAYIWPESDGFKAYYEVKEPGQIKDAPIGGVFASFEIAKQAVKHLLGRLDGTKPN
jgi:hypothetical protein